MSFASSRIALGCVTLAALLAAVGCGSDSTTTPGTTVRGFLDGTASDAGIASMLSSNNKSLVLVQTGAPSVRTEVPFGASTTITPTGVAIRGTTAAVPLGNAASVAIVDLTQSAVQKYFTFASGNATGIAWVDDSTVIVCNQGHAIAGRIRTNRAGGAITDTVKVALFPTGVVVNNGRVFIISSNLDANFTSVGNGVVTEINPNTMAVIRTFSTGGVDPQSGAFDAAGKLYVTNSGNFGAFDGTLGIINLATNALEQTVTGFGDFPGDITIDAQGRALVSSFSTGSFIWNTVTKTFIRSPTNALCAPTTAAAGAPCRGSSGGAFGLNGKIYTTFFGSASKNQPAYMFVFDGTTYALTDSINVPIGPSGLSIQKITK
ncbi:MAG: hypothetical protein ABJE47_18545 [bacterium]